MRRLQIIPKGKFIPEPRLPTQRLVQQRIASGEYAQALREDAERKLQNMHAPLWRKLLR